MDQAWFYLSLSNMGIFEILVFMVWFLKNQIWKISDDYFFSICLFSLFVGL